VVQKITEDDRRRWEDSMLRLAIDMGIAFEREYLYKGDD